ncbi:MAG: cytochrome c oxidase subunit 2A [Gammaproteobacteria bacterium]
MEAHPKPSGTIAILFIYALIILVLWGGAYFALLVRGATE